MSNLYDYKKFAVLYVDDEEKSLKYFTRAFGDQFKIYTAPNAEEGFKILQEHKDEIAILITDQRMPGEKGVQLLERVRQVKPTIIRMLATAYSDLEAAISAVNTGAIYKYIHKPWDVPQLEITLKRALEFFIVQSERDSLLHEKLSVLQNMVITDRVLGLGILAAGLNHRLKNTMRAVSSFLDLAPVPLREESVNFEALRDPNYWPKFYSHVQKQVNRIMEVVEGAIHADSGKTTSEAIQTSATIVSAIERNRSALSDKGVVVDNAISAALPTLQGDQRKFGKAIDLLLANIAARATAETKVAITGEASQDNCIKIEIRDNAPGIDDSLRALFNPFAANKPSDSGINLLAAFLLVHHHGGKVEITNDKAGTTTKLSFPCGQEAIGSKEDERRFIAKVLANEELWERLLT